MCRWLDKLFAMRKPKGEPMREGIQSFMASAGETACYALCVIRIAEIETGREIDPIRAMQQGIDKGHISFDWEDYNNGYNFFMHDPAAFLRMLTEDSWTARHDTADYKSKMGEYVVQRWERQTTGKTFAHFRLPDWDSLHNSQTVRLGRIVSTRVFWRV